MADIFNILQFVIDYNIDYTDNHHHCTQNNINIHCPFCPGSKNFHLGIHRYNGSIHCWRCGGHSVANLIKTCLKVSWGDVKTILAQYNTKGKINREDKENKRKIVRPELIQLPGITELTPKHQKYLAARKFSPAKLMRLWNLQSTGIAGEYKFRIYIPLIYQGEIVSYTARGTLPSQNPRYLTCGPQHEMMHHKRLLYGLDYVPAGKVVVVEGPSDVWRMGPGAVCLFGTSYTMDQILLLSQFQEIYIMLDMEDKSTRAKTEKMAVDLSCITDAKIFNVEYDGDDPGSLPQEYADEIMDEIFGRKQGTIEWE